jgi:hypothetical protein
MTWEYKPGSKYEAWIFGVLLYNTVFIDVSHKVDGKQLELVTLPVILLVRFHTTQDF